MLIFSVIGIVVTLVSDKAIATGNLIPSTSDPRRCQIPQFNDLAMADMNISQ